MDKQKLKLYGSWAAQIIAAVIILQTLYFKFTAHPDSVLLFSTLGVEPWGRITLGIIELIVSVFLLIPKTAVKAAVASMFITGGAILTHIFIIGVNFNNDGGALFSLALISFIASIVVIALNKEKLLHPHASSN